MGTLAGKRLGLVVVVVVVVVVSDAIFDDVHVHKASAMHPTVSESPSP